MAHRRRRLLSAGRGFTLIELLVVISILSAIGVAILGAVSAGIKIWKKSADIHNYEDVRLFYEKVTGDLRNMAVLSQLPFEGKDRELSFAILTPRGADTGYSEIRRVIYSFNSSRSSVERQEMDFTQAMSRDKKASAKTMLDNVSLFTMAYYYRSEDTSLKQKNFPKQGEIPEFLEIRFNYRPDKFNTVSFLERIEVPVAKKTF